MLRMRRSPERGRFQLVLDCFEAFVPTALRVGRGVRHKGGVNTSEGVDQFVGPWNGVAGHHCLMPWKHSNLIAVLVLHSSDWKQQGSIVEAGPLRLKEGQIGHVFARLERIEMGHKGVVNQYADD